jgi:hypothetical protein
MVYPRALRPKEQDLLESVLPVDRPGYRQYRELLSRIVVLGEGWRGAGNLVLGISGDRPDVTSRLAPVVAYGIVETTRDAFSVTVREVVGDQIDVEIVSSRGEEVPDHFEEKRRWTYSTWAPGSPSPATGERAREVRVSETLVLGILSSEQRLLLHDSSTGMIHLIPITSFYNELMLHKNIRDPKTALNAKLLFQNPQSYSDENLRSSFISYNNLKRRVSIVETPPAPRSTGIVTYLKMLFGKEKP